ncbi:MAG TPA: exodeoxyribonuclease VII large subunit [Ruminococcus sp.]|nr:exodeoxyribonuclease VII large subunit [Ruminococcus sp.]
MSILTVSQLNRYVASILHEDAHLRTILLRGEIANFTRNFRSGHCYFSLRDEEASVRAVMFRFNADRLKFQPENGMHVIVQGTVNLYEKDGAYQVNLTDMQPDGIGAQALALQQRREKLAKLGYFSPERKRPLPMLPKKIGIVTSRSGAALQDMLQILTRRYPIGNVCIYPAMVQGDTAPASIANALAQAGADGCDVILMGRGGGSNEDLSAFQSEEVAHAVFASPVPVVSAVGHETDHCIADEVADLRAPTPSAAAELAVPSREALMQTIVSLEEGMQHVLQTMLAQKEQQLSDLMHRFQSASPVHSVQLHAEQLAAVRQAMQHAMENVIQNKTQDWLLLLNKMEACSPVAILRRGYALVYHGESLVRKTSDVQIGESISIRLSEGSLTAAVTEIRKEDSKDEV